MASRMELPGTPQNLLSYSWSACIGRRRRPRIGARSLYSVVRSEIGQYSSGVWGLVVLGRHVDSMILLLGDVFISEHMVKEL